MECAIPSEIASLLIFLVSLRSGGSLQCQARQREWWTGTGPDGGYASERRPEHALRKGASVCRKRGEAAGANHRGRWGSCFRRSVPTRTRKPGSARRQRPNPPAVRTCPVPASLDRDHRRSGVKNGFRNNLEGSGKSPGSGRRHESSKIPSISESLSATSLVLQKQRSTRSFRV